MVTSSTVSYTRPGKLGKSVGILYGRSSTVVPVRHGRFTAHWSNDAFSFIASDSVEKGRTTMTVDGPFSKKRRVRGTFRHA